MQISNLSVDQALWGAFPRKKGFKSFRVVSLDNDIFCF